MGAFPLIDDGIRVCGQAHLLGGVVVADWDQPALTAHFILNLLSAADKKRPQPPIWAITVFLVLLCFGIPGRFCGLVPGQTAPPASFPSTLQCSALQCSALKYTFIVPPGANPVNLRLPQGELFPEEIPVYYQFGGVIFSFDLSTSAQEYDIINFNSKTNKMFCMERGLRCTANMGGPSLPS